MRVALIRGNLVENVIVSTMAFASTLGYSMIIDVTELPVYPGCIWNGGTDFSPPAPEILEGDDVTT